MELSEFIAAFQELLQRDEPVTADDVLSDLEEWDSLAIMATIAWFDKTLGVSLNFGHFKNAVTVADVAALVPGLRQ